MISGNLLTLGLTSILVMLASLAGVIVVWSGAGKWIEKNLSYLTSFAAGVFLIVSARLVIHTLEFASTDWLAALYILGGVTLIVVFFSAVPFFHHHHQRDADHEHHVVDVRRILFGDALHNIGDGLLLTMAFSTSGAVGFLAAIGVLVHETVQEVSEFFVLKEGGFSTKKALLINFAVSSTMLIGVGAGLIATTFAATLTAPLLGVTAGSFLVIVGHDLIPHSVQASQEKHDWWWHIGWFLTGIAIMLLITAVIGESH